MVRISPGCVDIIIICIDTESLRRTSTFCMIIGRGDEMQTGIESFLLINFVLDIALMTIVSKYTETFRLLSVIAAAAICTVFGLLSVCFPDPWYSPVMQILLMIPLSMLISGSSNIRIWGSSAMVLIAGLMIVSGCERFLSGDSIGHIPAILSTLAALLFLYILMAHKKRLRNNWSIELCLSANGATARFTALIDTGNRLHEPLSGLPVLIVEKVLIDSIIPKTGYRSVAFGGLGGNGVLKCFKPDFIWIVCGKKMCRAPDAWVAVSPSDLPGPNRALAPSEFALL